MKPGSASSEELWPPSRDTVKAPWNGGLFHNQRIRAAKTAVPAAVTSAEYLSLFQRTEKSKGPFTVPEGLTFGKKRPVRALYSS